MGNRVSISISAGSCGRAAGADDLIDVFESSIRGSGVDGVVLKKVGCSGECELEPVVRILSPGIGEKVYTRVDAGMMKNIIDLYINNSLSVNERSTIF